MQRGLSARVNAQMPVTAQPMLVQAALPQLWEPVLGAHQTLRVPTPLALVLAAGQVPVQVSPSVPGLVQVPVHVLAPVGAPLSLAGCA